MSLRLDIRTKILLMLVASLAVFLANTLWFEVAVVAGILVLQWLCGRAVPGYGLLAAYVALFLLQVFVMPHSSRAVAMFLSIVAVQFRKMFPLLMVLVLIVRTTRVHELIATMTKIRAPKPATVTVAVTLRYFPTLAEEWRLIRDAMRVRTVDAQQKNPIQWLGRRFECYVVPLFVSATKMSDELATAAITRGIENPAPGTCRGYRPMAVADYGVMSVSLLLIAAAVAVRVVG